MSRALQRLRANTTAAHVGPLVAFMLLSLVPGWFRIENSALPWYRQQPEHWWYPVQIALCAGLLWWWRSHYQWGGCRLRHLPTAAAGAVLGIAVWVWPGWLYQHWTAAGAEPAAWWRWLGLADRSQGFDLSLLAENPALQYASLAARFARMTVIVPLVEELCWRGWLMRFVIAGDKPFTRIPFGTHSWRAYGVSTFAVVLIHASEDWAAAFVWASLMYALAVHTRSLGACVVMHALGNLLLGLHVMHSGQLGYW